MPRKRCMPQGQKRYARHMTLHTSVHSEVNFIIHIIQIHQTATTMENFYLAMTLYPAVFRLAQEEIDRIIGDDRLPSFADRGSLPYITAICKEVHRWEVVLPTGMHLYRTLIHECTFNYTCSYPSCHKLHNRRGYLQWISHPEGSHCYS